MKVRIHAVRFDIDEKLLKRLQKKLDKLDKHFDRIIEGDVYLRVEKPQAHDNKVTEIKLNVPGRELFAKRQSGTFEESSDLAIEALRRQVVKLKGKQMNGWQ